MPTRRDFTGDNGKVCGDTWQIVLPFTVESGVEISMTLRRLYREANSVLCVITNGTDSVAAEEGGGTRFRFERGVTAAIEPGLIWYDAKAYAADTNELLTHWYGQILVLPTGDPDGIPDDTDIPEFGSDALHGIRGGGPLHPLAVLDGAAGFLSGDEKRELADLVAAGVEVPRVRALSAGAGLTGGGDLSADRSFAVGAHVDGSIVVHADDVQVGVLATDAQHGNRGGGPLHPLAVIDGAAGFFSGEEKRKLFDIIPGGNAVPSVFGRVGAIVAVTGDYAASEVANDSSVGGSTVRLALETTAAALLSHTSNLTNPHALTKAQITLGNVTNDAQLTRGAGDFALFTSKPAPVAGDVLLIEDSAAANAKKSATLKQLVYGGLAGAISGAGLGIGDLGAVGYSVYIKSPNASGFWMTVQNGNANNLFVGRQNGTVALAVPTALTSNVDPVLKSTATWNNASVAFSGWELDVTNTASLATSKLLDLKTGGVSVFSVSPTGTTALGTLAVAGSLAVAGVVNVAAVNLNLTHNNGGIITASQGLSLNGNGVVDLQAWQTRVTGLSPTAVTPLLSVTHHISTNWQHTSGVAVGLAVLPIVVQTGTAGYTALKIAAIHTTTGSGAKNLILASVGATTVFGVSIGGLVTALGGVDVSGVGAAASALTFVATSDVPATTWTAGTPSNNPAGYMRASVGGATRYIPYWT
jgi:hypothetical protein